ncbi:MAG: hypothetical protein PHR96_01510 [Clostridia bacterium]|nr:hypothetical protein [Clostridia bacterium]
MLNKRMQKLIATGTALLITLTVMIGAAWAILSTSKVGLTVNVSYDPLVTAKVYLATNSSTAGEFYQDSPTVDGAGETTAFNTANSALVFNTKDTTPLTKNLFEQLGSGASNGLKCDASGEIEFYVYVENYSTTDSVYYRTNIEFVGTGEKIAPFSTVTNPSYETAETAVEVGSPSISLLTFKIKSTNTTGLNANAIQIKINLRTDLPLTWTLNQYKDGAYAGMYYLEMGNAPQSFAGTTTEINATPTSETWVDGAYYYTNDLNQNIRYVIKDDNYYSVEPIRWIIITDEAYPTTGVYGVDYLSTQILTANDRTMLNNISSRQIVLLSENLIADCIFPSKYSESTFFSKINPIRDKIFTTNEKALLKTMSLGTKLGSNGGTFTGNFWLMARDNDPYYSGHHLMCSSYLATNDLSKGSKTSYLAGDTTNALNYSEYLLRGYRYPSAGQAQHRYISESGVLSYLTQSSGDLQSFGIRAMIAINWDY